MNWVEQEDKKYSALYKGGYPIGDPFRIVNKFGYTANMKACDLGCGRGVLARHFKDYTGVDVSEFIISENKKKYPDRKFYHSSMNNLSLLRNEKFDVVICADVMEHIPEDKIHEVLSEIRKLNTKVLAMSISTRPSVFLDHDGGNLHLTVWSADKWEDELSKIFHINKSDRVGSVLTVELS